MCIVCTEWEKGKLTANEALRNLGEISNDPENSEEQMEHYTKAILDIYAQATSES